MDQSLYFLIEGGKALEVVKRHIQEINDAHAEACKLARELGVKRFCADPLTGRLSGVVFEAGRQRHPDFLTPNRHGVCFPRQKSELFRRIQSQKGHPITCDVISQELGVPLSLSWKDGFSCIGHPFRAAGFMFLGKEPPYAMYIPDVQAEIKRANRGRPHEPARSFKPEFEGCKRILKAEWELIVAQHDAAKARRAEDERMAAEAAKRAAAAQRSKKSIGVTAKAAKTVPTTKKKSLAIV